jgi:hypothetical protein
MTWLEKMEFFLNSDHCPNFVKAGVEKAKIHVDNVFFVMAMPFDSFSICLKPDTLIFWKV